MNSGEQIFSLRWNNHENNICVILESMLKRGILVDVTLSCEGKSLKVHRAILSACSPYFEELFTETDHSHPIIILKDVKPEELQALIDYMYTGQVTVSRSKLNGFLKIAESLKIRGLANAETYQEGVSVNHDSCVPPRKRRRNFSFEDTPVNGDHHGYTSAVPQRASEEPTDLSMPKLDHNPPFQHLASSSISFQYENMCSQGSKICVKPRESLIAAPVAEVSDVSPTLISHEQEGIIPLRVDTSVNIIHSDHDENTALESSFSHHVPSDDEEPDNTVPDLEVGAPVVRSGICSVCGCFRSDLRQHMESHSGQSFQCHICGRAYPRRKTLNQHIKRSHQLYARSVPVVDTPHAETRLRQQEVSHDVS